MHKGFLRGNTCIRDHEEGARAAWAIHGQQVMTRLCPASKESPGWFVAESINFSYPEGESGSCRKKLAFVALLPEQPRESVVSSQVQQGISEQGPWLDVAQALCQDLRTP